MDIPLNEIKTEEIPKNENIESEIINVKIIKQEKSKQKNYENINSPQLIQQILKLSTQSIQNDYHHQNKLIKSLYSFNDSILPIIEDDFNDNININFNPRIQFLLQKDKLACMNFGQTNKNNNFLVNKIEQYNDLKQKISEYKSNNSQENIEKENNDNDNNNEKDLTLKLFLINHPLIDLFKDEIDIIEIKKEIEKEYQKKMKDNSDYKPGPLNPHLINIQEPIDSQNEEEDEIIEGSENSIEESSEEPSESIDHSYHEMLEPNEPLQQNENNQINEPDIHVNNNENEENNNEVPINLNNNNIEHINEQNNQLQINPPQNIIEPIVPIINLAQPLPNLVNPPQPIIVQPPQLNIVPPPQLNIVPPPQPIIVPPPLINIQFESHNNELMDIDEMENDINPDLNNNDNQNEENQNNDNQNEEKKENNE